MCRPCWRRSSGGRRRPSAAAALQGHTATPAERPRSQLQRKWDPKAPRRGGSGQRPRRSSITSSSSSTCSSTCSRSRSSTSYRSSRRKRCRGRGSFHAFPAPQRWTETVRRPLQVHCSRQSADIVRQCTYAYAGAKTELRNCCQRSLIYLFTSVSLLAEVAVLLRACGRASPCVSN